jgi:hypothetical protein
LASSAFYDHRNDNQQKLLSLFIPLARPLYVLRLWSNESGKDLHQIVFGRLLGRSSWGENLFSGFNLVCSKEGF